MILGVETEVKNTENENIIENIAKSELINETSNFTENKTRQESIKDYITNLVTRNTSEQEIQDNVEANLKTVNEVNQLNELIIDNLTLESEFDVVQRNKDAANISSNYQMLRDQIASIINKAVEESNIVSQVEEAMDAGNVDNYLNNLIAEADKKTAVDSTIKNQVQTFKMVEHILAGVSTNVSNIKNKARTTNVTDDLVKNVCVASVINDTDMYSRISQAFNQTVENVIKNKSIVKQAIEATVKDIKNQTNRLVLSNATIKSKLTVEQVNESESTIEASALISSTVNMSGDSTVQAIASDMIGLTQSFGAKNDTEGKTDMSGSAKTSTDLGNGTDTAHVHSQAAEIVSLVVFLVIAIVVAIVAFKFLKSKSSPVPTAARPV